VNTPSWTRCFEDEHAFNGGPRCQCGRVAYADLASTPTQPKEHDHELP